MSWSECEAEGCMAESCVSLIESVWCNADSYEVSSVDLSIGSCNWCPAT